MYSGILEELHDLPELDGRAGRERIRELLENPDDQNHSLVVLDRHGVRTGLESDATITTYVEVYGGKSRTGSQRAGRLSCLVDDDQRGVYFDYDVELTRDELDEFASYNTGCDRYAEEIGERRAAEAEARRAAREANAPKKGPGVVRGACRVLGKALLGFAEKGSPKDEAPSFDGRGRDGRNRNRDRTFS